MSEQLSRPPTPFCPKRFAAASNLLMLVARKVRVGAMKGDRRSIKRGNSIEFADYRNYVPGDDLRQLDWNIYARLERPFHQAAGGRRRPDRPFDPRRLRQYGFPPRRSKPIKRSCFTPSASLPGWPICH